jgi:hypothetical protein
MRLARETKVFLRARGIATAVDLLRLILGYCLGDQGLRACPGAGRGTPRASLRQTQQSRYAMRGSPLWTPWTTRSAGGARPSGSTKQGSVLRVARGSVPDVV